ncbi:hypothetical protein ENHAE0001_0539 [Enhydrobacter aerosaccus SK60]|nr:hypothetical protein ENHAE0001_0539 [Enhydrobacter aerosaccus SK60]
MDEYFFKSLMTLYHLSQKNDQIGIFLIKQLCNFLLLL